MNTEIPNSLASMAERPQWVTWKFVPRAGQKDAKVPTHPVGGHPVNPLDSAQWMSAEIAQGWARHAGLGIGFVFTAEDPFFFVDLDSCLGTDGKWQQHALDILARFPGAAAEVSVSGNGLHVFGRYEGPLDHSNKHEPLRAELYTHSRFVAIGSGATGDCSTDHTSAIRALAVQFFPIRVDGGDGIWTEDECPEFTGKFGDDELIRKALRSQTAGSAFGDQASFKDLWEANEDKLSAAFPPTGPGAFDGSRADLALASRLSFWTGKNCERVQKLMRKSGLVRSKWEREKYLQDTILLAVSNTASVYSRPAAIDPEVLSVDVTAATVDGIEVRTGFQLMTPEAQIEHFRGCAYAASVHRVLSPKGVLLDAPRFQVMFGGYNFALDSTCEKVVPDAWKVYTQSQTITYRKADALCFHPGVHELFVQDNNELCANTWRDPKPERLKGDPAPFLNHLRKLLPDGDDAEILRCYLAACVQYPGKKFQWAPLIQGVQGCGKTTLAAVLERAVGHNYVHVLKGSALTNQFNGWLAKSIVAVVEDLHISNDRSWAMENIKPMITARRLQIERKGVDQTTEDNCCKFILTSNHQDALPLDRNERRFAMFFCKQQSEQDLITHGMGLDYFDELYDWLDERNGFAIVSEYLHACEIPRKWNPATGAKRAPKTSSHEAAIVASRSQEAQLIHEAIEAGDPGFRDGWISTVRATDLLHDHRMSLTPRVLMGVLQGLGYVRHPALEKGRTSRPVAAEGKRPRLYVLVGHASSGFDGSKVVAAYEEAQGYPSPQPSNVLPLGLTSV